jgi:hypothetical protein
MLSQQFAITEVCWKEWKNHFVGAFIIVLTITAVTLNTSCNDYIGTFFYFHSTF